MVVRAIYSHLSDSGKTCRMLHFRLGIPNRDQYHRCMSAGAFVGVVRGRLHLQTVVSPEFDNPLGKRQHGTGGSIVGEPKVEVPTSKGGQDLQFGILLLESGDSCFAEGIGFGLCHVIPGPHGTIRRGESCSSVKL
jgi:hypothetical protein